MEKDITLNWQQYEAGKRYKTQINLYTETSQNTNFYFDKQWLGVKASGLDKPVFNIIKRVANYFRAVIMPDDIKINYIPELINDLNPNDKEQEIKNLVELANAHVTDIWEKNKMESMIRDELILDAELSGDYCVYVSWNKDIDIGLPKMDGVLLEEPIKGDIDNRRISNVNVFFGNPNDHRVNHRGLPVQPYILIAFREPVVDLIKEAKEYKGEPDKITSDLDNAEQTGIYGQIEIDKVGETSGKATVILKLFPKNGKIYCSKEGKFGIIRPEWETKLSIYPIAWANWDRRDNCYHGQALATGIIDNQIFINKSFALLMQWLKLVSVPKIFYDRTRMSKYTNKVAEAIGVDGDVNGVAMSMSPSQLSNQVFLLIDKVIQYTKEFLGVSDVGLGQIKNPDNASALGTAIEQLETPLNNYRSSLYQFVEDLGYIWLDYMANYYGKRYVAIPDSQGDKTVKEVDFSLLKTHKFRIKIDVGSVSKWNELATMRLLDNLLQIKEIPFVEYLRNLPKGKLPRQNEMIRKLEEDEKKQEQVMLASSRLQSLPEEEQQRLAQLPDEQFQAEVMAMMNQ